jgi:hypothetical protein
MGNTTDTQLRVGPEGIITFTMWSDAIEFSTVGWIGSAHPSATSISPTTVVAATSTVTGSVPTKHRIVPAATVAATSTAGGTINKPGTPTVPSTYGVGTYGVAVFGGSGAPPLVGIKGNVLATSVVSGGLTRVTSGGGIYTPPYTPPTPPPVPALGTFGPFAQAVYDLLNGDGLAV